MNAETATLIAHLPTWMVVFMVILCRVAALVITMPGLNSQSAPTRVRAAFAIGVSFLLFPLLLPRFEGASSDDVLNPARLIVFIASEVICGGLIGWLAQLMLQSFPVAAQIISTFIGLSNVLQPDPELGAQSTPLSHVAELLMTVTVFAADLYVLPLHALVGSYDVFPPGHFPLMGDVAHSVTQATGGMFLLAFQLAMPFVLIGTIWPIMLGLLSRFTPGLQVYMLAMPAQILGGILLFALLLGTMLGTWSNGVDAALQGLPGGGG
ncbi:putative flagellar biosynthetic protein fliR [Acetobacter estunensis NRIC 0472]|nr:flagellar biosynthetic protein FliR [Acetobacter estunensis]GBQ28338.1 putative flagellar biosynthetic protein fliR [Acetobacter estunensis NRIC 0472]